MRDGLTDYQSLSQDPKAAVPAVPRAASRRDADETAWILHPKFNIQISQRPSQRTGKVGCAHALMLSLVMVQAG